MHDSHLSDVSLTTSLQTLHDKYCDYKPFIMSLCRRRDSDGTTVSSLASDKDVATE